MAPKRNRTEIPRARWMWVGAVVACGLLGAGMLRLQQERALESAALLAGEAAPSTRVVRHLRASELITSRIETIVRAQNTDENWFGTVVATVEAPARLSYGVDLSKLEASRVLFSPIGSVYSVVVPVPRRIATEVFTGQEKTDVELAGLRMRSMAGEAQLGLARTRLHEQALKMRLTGSELARVREGAREQIEQLVRRIAGESASVRVRFEDEDQTSLAIQQ